MPDPVSPDRSPDQAPPRPSAGPDRRRYWWSRPPAGGSHTAGGSGSLASWLFILAGNAAIAAAVLLPARESLDEALDRRDALLAVREGQRQLLDRHERYLAALDRGEPGLLLALAERHMHLAPDDHTLLATHAPDPTGPIDLFPGLAAVEPTRPIALPGSRRVDSRLAWVVRSPRGRLLMLAGGVLCLLIGLLPPARPR